jgi:hypothetical protein
MTKAVCACRAMLSGVTRQVCIKCINTPALPSAYLCLRKTIEDREHRTCSAILPTVLWFLSPAVGIRRG